MEDEVKIVSIFYKINRFNKSDFHKSICLKNTVDGIENNNGDFNKIIDSISRDGETKKIKNEGDTKSVPFEGVKGRDSIKVARFFQNHQDEHFTPKQTMASLLHLSENLKATHQHPYPKHPQKHYQPI